LTFRSQICSPGYSYPALCFHKLSGYGYSFPASRKLEVRNGVTDGRTSGEVQHLMRPQFSRFDKTLACVLKTYERTDW